MEVFVNDQIEAADFERRVRALVTELAGLWDVAVTDRQRDKAEGAVASAFIAESMRTIMDNGGEW
jgi:hypothetical protein